MVGLLPVQQVTVYRGTAPTLRFTLTTNGSISGWTMRFVVRKKAADPDPVVSSIAATIHDAGSISTPGVVDVALTKADTLAWEAPLWYDAMLERTNTGAETPLAPVELRVKPDVVNAL